MKNGSISIIVLLLGILCSIIVGGLVLFATVGYQVIQRNESSYKALSLAESGLNYYRWHLSHSPDDYTDGTGKPGPYIHTITDPQGDAIGTYSLTITPPTSTNPLITITSTGASSQNPDIKRSVQAQFGSQSLASFSFLHNSNVWFGQGMKVYGDVFSNGGIRMDGENTGAVRSAKDTYTCGVETGCYPNPEEKPGVWGNGGPTELWEYPVAPVDFDSISIDFTTMRQKAIDTGLHLNPSGSSGYHIVFNSNGTFSLYKVTSTQSRKGYSPDNGCENLYQIIRRETLIGTYSIANTPIIFAEDIVWVEGTVNGKITVIAAKFPFDTENTNIWINNSITYVAKDGNHTLGLIAQNDIIFVLDLPQKFEIDAAMLAQKGRIIRHHYRYVPFCSVYSEATRNELIIYGSVISNKKSYWNFSSSGGGSPSSGFVKRTITYDADLLYKPPPYFPTTGEIDMISWTEVKNP